MEGRLTHFNHFFIKLYEFTYIEKNCLEITENSRQISSLSHTFKAKPGQKVGLLF